MIPPRSRISQAIRRWRADEDGSVAVETLMMVPLLAWAMLATLSYFDAYRTEAISTKASLTLADMFSRETDWVDAAYIDGAASLLGFLTIKDNNPQMRISVVKWEADDPVNLPLIGGYSVVWSHTRGGEKLPLTDLVIDDYTNQIPVMSHMERIIVVETWTDYEAPYTIGLDDFTMQTFTVMSPRFASQLCYNPTPLLGAATSVC